MRHVYVNGVAMVVSGEVAAKRLTSGEWYVCTAEHKAFDNIPSDEPMVIYHRDERHRMKHSAIGLINPAPPANPPA